MRIVVVGEGMIKLSKAGQGLRLGQGGDTLNTVIHLARHGRDVAYATALGADPFSDDLRAGWAAEGLDTSLVLTDPEWTGRLRRQLPTKAVEQPSRGSRRARGSVGVLLYWPPYA